MFFDTFYSTFLWSFQWVRGALGAQLYSLDNILLKWPYYQQMVLNILPVRQLNSTILTIFAQFVNFTTLSIKTREADLDLKATYCLILLDIEMHYCILHS